MIITWADLYNSDVNQRVYKDLREIYKDYENE